MGHKLVAVPTVAGGMNAIEFNDDGQLSGCMLARRRHADRPRRWTGTAGSEIWPGVIKECD
jgi:hypothetical protein